MDIVKIYVMSNVQVIAEIFFAQKTNIRASNISSLAEQVLKLMTRTGLVQSKEFHYPRTLIYNPTLLCQQLHPDS